MRSVVNLIGVALICNVALIACTETSSTQVPPISSNQSPESRVVLKNSSWKLEHWERKGSAIKLAPKTELSLNFQDNQVNGSAGCNSFSGTFKMVNNQLSLGTLQTTQKGCDEVVMNQETQFLAALQSVRRIAADASGRLVLFYEKEADQGVLFFVPKK
jgi:heat shock protein HslJ